VRRVFIATGIAIFLVYCWASVAYQNEVRVPDYKLVTVDLLGGVSRQEWDANQQGQFQQLMELEGRNYQLPEDAVVHAWPGRHRPAPDGVVPVDQPLGSEDFTHFINEKPGEAPVMVRLRDTGAFTSLIGRNYLLRDTLYDPEHPDGPPLFTGGTPLDKDTLDKMRVLGYRSITVTGHGSTVSFQLGTALMIAVIFLTLVAALKPVLWEPFMVLLEKRRREMDMGSEAERQNQQDAVRYEEEKRARTMQMHREVQSLKMAGQNQIAREAGEIVKTARDSEKATKLAGLSRLARESEEAKFRIEEDIPALAEAVADLLTPGRKDG
jgi:F0F1-type ATP synthase, subunit b